MLCIKVYAVIIHRIIFTTNLSVNLDDKHPLNCYVIGVDGGWTHIFIY